MRKLFPLLILLATPAYAQQSITTIDLGDGIAISTDSQGNQATTIDLGGGISTTTTSPAFGTPVPRFGDYQRPSQPVPVPLPTPWR